MVCFQCRRADCKRGEYSAKSDSLKQPYRLGDVTAAEVDENTRNLHRAIVICDAHAIALGGDSEATSALIERLTDRSISVAPNWRKFFVAPLTVEP